MTDFGRRVNVHKTTHQDGGADELDAALLDGRINFIDRGDPASHDFTLSDIITDGTWRAIDFSSILPSGTIFAVLRVGILDDNIDSYFRLAKNGIVNNYTSAVLRTQVANVPIEGMFIVACDSNRYLKYKAFNTTWTEINVIVVGWFV